MRQTNTSILESRLTSRNCLVIYLLSFKKLQSKSQKTHIYKCIGLNGFEPLDISFLSIIRINKTKHANKILL